MLLQGMAGVAAIGWHRAGDPGRQSSAAWLEPDGALPGRLPACQDRAAHRAESQSGIPAGQRGHWCIPLTGPCHRTGIIVPDGDHQLGLVTDGLLFLSGASQETQWDQQEIAMKRTMLPFLALAIMPVAAAPASAQSLTLAQGRADVAERGFVSSHPLAQGLVRIGETAIAKEDDAALRAYFAPDFVVHLGGATRNVDQLMAHFASMRSAFPDLRVVREFAIVEGHHVGSRTRFTGTFAHPWKGSPVGDAVPTGKPVSWAVNNIFRFNPDGTLAEEWVEHNIPDLRSKLGTD
jgi:predicted ester cyclase